MFAADDLRADLEAKINVNALFRNITTKLKLDLEPMRSQGYFDEGQSFIGGFDITGQYMVELGLIRTLRSPFNPGTYSYQKSAWNLYLRLKEEKYYES